MTAALLGRVFLEDEPPPPPPPAGSALEGNLGVLLGQLAARSTWTRTEFDAMAIALDLPPHGALEMLNQAALDAYGDVLLDGTDMLELDPDALKELL